MLLVGERPPARMCSSIWARPCASLDAEEARLIDDALDGLAAAMRGRERRRPVRRSRRPRAATARAPARRREARRAESKEPCPRPSSALCRNSHGLPVVDADDDRRLPRARPTANRQARCSSVRRRSRPLAGGRRRRRRSCPNFSRAFPGELRGARRRASGGGSAEGPLRRRRIPLDRRRARRRDARDDRQDPRLGRLSRPHPRRARRRGARPGPGRDRRTEIRFAGARSDA